MSFREQEVIVHGFARSLTLMGLDSFDNGPVLARGFVHTTGTAQGEVACS